MTSTEPKPVLKTGTLYWGDNGRCFCGAHGGHTALYTGRTISGQRVHRITQADAEAFKAEVGRLPRCETCGMEVHRG